MTGRTPAAGSASKWKAIAASRLHPYPSLLAARTPKARPNESDFPRPPPRGERRRTGVRVRANLAEELPDTENSSWGVSARFSHCIRSVRAAPALSTQVRVDGQRAADDKLQPPLH